MLYCVVTWSITSHSIIWSISNLFNLTHQWTKQMAYQICLLSSAHDCGIYYFKTVMVSTHSWPTAWLHTLKTENWAFFKGYTPWVFNGSVIIKSKIPPCVFSSLLCVFISPQTYLNFFFFFHFVSSLQALPFSKHTSVAGEMLTLKSFSSFCGSMIPLQVGRNDVYWIDVSQSNTLSKYICIHWAAPLNHTALAAVLRGSFHPEGKTLANTVRCCVDC